jgi:hypothetical protein
MEAMRDEVHKYKVRIFPEESPSVIRLFVEWENGKATVNLENWHVLGSTNGAPPSDLMTW